MKKKEPEVIKVHLKPETQVFCVQLDHTGDDEVSKAEAEITKQAQEQGFTLGEFKTQSGFDVYTRTTTYVITATGTK